MKQITYKRRILSVIISVFMLISSVPSFGLNVCASDSISERLGENVFFTLNKSTGLLTVSGSGAMYDDDDYSAVYQYADSVKKVVVESGVTSLSSCLFDGCTNLTGVSLAGTVKSLDGSTFRYCTSLTEIDLSNGIESIGPSSFCGCSNLKNVKLGDSVVTIGADAFERCDSLTSIYIPKNVKNIPESPFSECPNFTTVTVATDNPYFITVNGVLFNKDKTRLICCPSKRSVGNYVIPSSVTSLAEAAFSYCGGLTDVTIPDGVTTIPDWAFHHCNALKSVTFGNKTKKIGWAAFSECKALGSVSLPTTLTTLDSFVFDFCESLKSIVIPDSVSVLEDSVFQGCTSLKTVTIGKNVTETDSFAFNLCDSLESINVSSQNANYTSENGILFNKNKTKLVRYPAGSSRESYSIPSTVNTVCEHAFESSHNLKSIAIPSSVTTIKEMGFNDCRNVKLFTVPDSVTSIGYYAFSNDKAVLYTGSATGAPWDADAVCKCVENDFAYADTAKTQLVKYIGNSEEVVIPNGVKSLGEKAFRNNKTMKTVRIPGSVTSIDINAFAGCEALEDAYYDGDEKSFNATGRDVLMAFGNACVHLSDGTVYGKKPLPTDDTQGTTTQESGQTAEKPADTKTPTAPSVKDKTKQPSGNAQKPAKTSIKKLSRKKKAFTVTWKKVKNVTGYQLQYSTKKNMKGSKTKTVKGASKTKMTVKKLKKRKRYYVRIRTYKTVGGKKVYSKWTKWKKVKIK